jgi:hypothetical protein
MKQQQKHIAMTQNSTKSSDNIKEEKKNPDMFTILKQ